jgi:hypothetical protein
VWYGRPDQCTHQLEASSVCSAVIFSSIITGFTVSAKSCKSIVLCQTLQSSCCGGSSNGGLQGLSWFSQPPAIQRLVLLVTEKSFLRFLKIQCLKISLFNSLPNYIQMFLRHGAMLMRCASMWIALCAWMRELMNLLISAGLGRQLLSGRQSKYHIFWSNLSRGFYSV